MLQRRVQGLRILNFRQDIEAFCDDVNIFTDTIQDFEKIDRAVVKFEALSGAILSRNKKCKILGLGVGRIRGSGLFPIYRLRKK